MIIFHVYGKPFHGKFKRHIQKVHFFSYAAICYVLSICWQKVTFFCLVVFFPAMSLCDDTLLCNFPKCRTKLNGFAWVTACSHVFCDQHGSGEFSRSPAICPACSSALSGKLDIVRTELSPSEEYKAMVLAGLRPDIILDISARALSFWSYQVIDSSNMCQELFSSISVFMIPDFYYKQIHQESMYQEYRLTRAEAQLKQMEKVLTQQNQCRELELTAMKGEIASLKKVNNSKAKVFCCLF